MGKENWTAHIQPEYDSDGKLSIPSGHQIITRESVGEEWLGLYFVRYDGIPWIAFTGNPLWDEDSTYIRPIEAQPLTPTHSIERKIMSLSILDVLRNAEYNLAPNSFYVQKTIGAEQLKNGIELLEKGYEPCEDFNALIEKFETVDKVPVKFDMPTSC